MYALPVTHALILCLYIFQRNASGETVLDICNVNNNEEVREFVKDKLSDTFFDDPMEIDIVYDDEDMIANTHSVQPPSSRDLYPHLNFEMTM